MKNMNVKLKFLLLIGFVLTAGCRETGKNVFVSTSETAVISCEAGRVTIETSPSGLEETGENE